jgi:hypothetical protein
MHQHLQHLTCSLKSTIKYALINGKLFGIIDVTINRVKLQMALGINKQYQSKFRSWEGGKLQSWKGGRSAVDF